MAGVIGVVCGTTFTCGAGLLAGTGSWCALPLFWFIGFPIGIGSASTLGIPAVFMCRRFGRTRWWQYAAAALVASIPVYIAFNAPFDSPRWQRSGVFDSMECIVAALAAGIAFWWISERVAPDKQG
ncbi:MAG: hypothetical protein ACXU8N_13240 [Telluria sp.]